MKTTLEIPDPVFRQAKARAALRGISLRKFITEAVEDKVKAMTPSGEQNSEPAWMRGFGSLADLAEENREIEKRIAEAFEIVVPEDRV